MTGAGPSTNSTRTCGFARENPVEQRSRKYNRICSERKNGLCKSEKKKKKGEREKSAFTVGRAGGKPGGAGPRLQPPAAHACAVRSLPSVSPGLLPPDQSSSCRRCGSSHVSSEAPNHARAGRRGCSSAAPQTEPRPLWTLLGRQKTAEAAGGPRGRGWGVGARRGAPRRSAPSAHPPPPESAASGPRQGPGLRGLEGAWVRPEEGGGRGARHARCGRPSLRPGAGARF